jgi:phage gp37-like protein
MSRVVRLNPRTAERLQVHQRPGETSDAVLRRLLGMPPAYVPPVRQDGGGYNHSVTRISAELYRLRWEFDVTFGDKRHRVSERITDRAAALRFARRWNLEMPA